LTLYGCRLSITVGTGGASTLPPTAAARERRPSPRLVTAAVAQRRCGWRGWQQTLGDGHANAHARGLTIIHEGTDCAWTAPGGHDAPQALVSRPKAYHTLLIPHPALPDLLQAGRTMAKKPRGKVGQGKEKEDAGQVGARSAHSISAQEQVFALVEQHGCAFSLGTQYVQALTLAATLPLGTPTRISTQTGVVQLLRLAWERLERMGGDGPAGSACGWAEMGAQDLADILLAVSKLRVDDRLWMLHEFVEAIVWWAGPQLPSFSCQALADTAQGLAVLGDATMHYFGDAVFMDALLVVAKPRLIDFNWQELAKMAWAPCTMHHVGAFHNLGAFLPVPRALTQRSWALCWKRPSQSFPASQWKPWPTQCGRWPSCAMWTLCSWATCWWWPGPSFPASH
jgi:hypothetical protein